LSREVFFDTFHIEWYVPVFCRGKPVEEFLLLPPDKDSWGVSPGNFRASSFTRGSSVVMTATAANTHLFGGSYL
jgi:hypothetical protein